MQRFITALLVVFWIVAAGLAPAGAEDEMCVPLGTITLEPPEGVQGQKSAVEFPHGQHFAYACQDCHHKWDKASAIVSCTTSGCHDLTAMPEKAQQGAAAEPAMRYFKSAFHENCIGCHKKLKAQLDKAEVSLSAPKVSVSGNLPTGCIECHPR